MSSNLDSLKEGQDKNGIIILCSTKIYANFLETVLHLAIYLSLKHS